MIWNRFPTLGAVLLADVKLENIMLDSNLAVKLVGLPSFIDYGCYGNHYDSQLRTRWTCLKHPEIFRNDGRNVMLPCLGCIAQVDFDDVEPWPLEINEGETRHSVDELIFRFVNMPRNARSTSCTAYRYITSKCLQNDVLSLKALIRRSFGQRPL